ncbi:TPA: T6SS immunity phospholipase A1-binding lipoprotein Tli1-KP [Klebsiella quasipneumoniae subsp. similipneumoniae]|uniref:T6SS immunity phospholipase A1-binding lipoprotein Tli1-KP n=1 Tax=Klebsiella quasipneumoniae TaxID=1463165 RepID=UPI00103470FE|nr:T6SS immunity phospholipase A1-binding lipoprotein Tli1-KP [Klebsiella quasipneumoniae]HBR1176118.1 T6SS immunity phospholipase A1-binding lipoprotein Tli1-KP [Klebsiella quasipneumoniae subsp. similipneumoniae]EIY5051344.1 T6SS immunity phospholipase A1-binding lipoprotein Tli1-KP [Klebsiella quasipneumoniae]EIY5106411.1 T6SS immunity phospholipase A1-binding lipoprotein Tli1-KP [Klebsiella quasipneumoniae]EIY5109432.1 T6SS immunity phospholipase A1-binding lipoprotein Tli1-KP [Klebsiella q
MKSALISTLLVGLLLLTGCAQPAARAGGGTIKAINHTKWAVNHFSVNGQSGIDSIGPFQGGGGGCCFSVPAHWTPGMTVRVDWETGVGYSMDFPGYQDRQKYLAWKKGIDAQKRQHSQTVPLPDYNGQEVCGITVHFLPCDDVKVTTSCWSPRNANYPIKEPVRMKEPPVCPK